MSATPGPWVAFRRDDQWGVYEQTEGLGEIIIAWVETSRPGFSHPTDAANARLIAAAPDLLAALEGLTRAREGQPGFRDAFRAAVDAIAKARGAK